MAVLEEEREDRREKKKITPAEAVKIGTLTRTQKRWKYRGTLRTFGKELNHERQSRNDRGSFYY